MEMPARNQLVVVNSFQKRESHKITYRSGNNRTEIDLLIVRSRKKKEQWWWNPEVEQAIQEKKEALKGVEEASEAEKTRLKQKYREKKNTANKAVVKARDKKQQEWCKRIEEDGGKKIIFQLARDRDRDRDSKDALQ